MASKGTVKVSGKEALLEWVRMCLEPYNIQINDFNASSWNDGSAFCVRYIELNWTCKDIFEWIKRYIFVEIAEINSKCP
jgi:hypothetical protein